jgi:threonine aldolase
MRRAMAEADVGDDVYGEDPTIQRLEARVAELLGKEAALFVPSGTMANQLALAVHTEPGDEVLTHTDAHILHYESGAAAALSGLQITPLPGPRGLPAPEAFATAIRGGYYWEPRTRLVWLENTANRAGGLVLDDAGTQAVVDVARAHALALHLDGARLWNAAVATGRSEFDLAAPFDTVSVCLSKGLGAPVGSLLAGPAALVQRAHRFRKRWGGGMRQVGILGAAGLYALDHHRARIADDHAHARLLAGAVQGLDGVSAAVPDTNIVMVDIPMPAAEAVSRLADAGVRVSAFGPHRLRLTTHLDVTDGDAAFAADALRRVLGGQ